MRVPTLTHPEAVLTAVVVALVIGQTPLAAPPPETQTIRGQVVDADGLPLSDATVRVLQQGLSMDRKDRQPDSWIDPTVVPTADDGSFSAQGLTGSNYVLRAEAPGYAPTTVAPVLAGSALTLTVHGGHAIRGRVLDAEADRPFAGATIVACDAAAFDFGRESCQLTRTDDSGGFRFANQVSRIICAATGSIL